MTQEETYQNMTKGRKYIAIRATDNKGIDCWAVMVDKPIPLVLVTHTFDGEQAEANVHAIAAALNLWTNLISKGINPESLLACVSIPS